MNKIVLSAIAALTLGSVTAGAVDLYEDANGQVFTQAGEGRTAIKTSTPLFSKTSKIKFSGLTYLGYTYNDLDSNLANGTPNTNSDTSDFEIRRAYFQVKAYLLDDPKSYYRVTFDISKDVTGDEKVRAKYAYLYLNNILPATGVELGLTHRPWHDYEEHNAWYFRNISKILIEDGAHGPDLSNSADFGVMLKTRTKYFDADYGIFNGEGYHSKSNGNGMSFEWRTTAHLLGVSGKDKQTTTTYLDASFFGQYNKGHKTVTVGAQTENQDLIFGGLHTVFNTPSYLVSAQYVKSQDSSNITNNVSKQSGSGYSANAEYRLGNEKQYRAFARYDSWTPEAISTTATSKKEDKGYILGAAWEQNKNVQWIGNIIVTDNEALSAKEKNNGTAYMLTAEVRF
ncbi:MAG: hypothetical protein QM497_10485 [Sulfurimonas sp.]